MADETWYRHANPISGLTRIFSLPLVVLPIWFMQEFFRDPLGFWYPPAALAAVGLWAWLNPRIFPKPKSFDSYLSRGVLGEKLWTELPKKLDAPMILTILQVLRHRHGLFRVPQRILGHDVFHVDGIRC